MNSKKPFENTPESINRKLDQFRLLLANDSLFSLTAEQQHSLREDAEKISRKLRSLQESFLTIGLLGGTGVGKSTLMNALAGAEIASASHRRPHTDRVLIYSHEEAGVLPSLPGEDLPWTLIPHRSDTIRQVLLCDLPDFDSLMGEHRERVIEFLEHLDLLVWVTSPEKYGDGRFYEFLSQVPKAERNFIFVLNKTDLLFQDESLEQGYQQLTRLARTFQEHLHKQSIDQPRLYILAAQEALLPDPLSPWNQFPSFRQEVFHRRDTKQVTAIKAANLDVEVQRLFSSLEAEVLNLARFQQVLAQSEKELEEQRESWVQAGEEAIQLWLARRIKPVMQSYKRDPSHLVGPGYSLAILLRALQRDTSMETDRLLDPSKLQPPEDATAGFRKRLEWVDEHLSHSVLRQGLPSSFEEKTKKTINVERRFESLGENFLNAVTLHIVEPPLPAFRLFKTAQWVSYLMLLSVLLIAVGGEKAWLNVLNEPGVSSVLQLLISIINTLFNGKGLAALGSYVLLNLFLAFRFYRRYGTLLAKSSQKALDVLKKALLKAWGDCLNGVLLDLSKLREETREKMATIADIKGSKQ
ncbi:MAG: 50S ribosome-binding GTPase [Deltaproteobacteria bacterium]|nr:50S ribosome-binding GTPase [Deltaproteobacteria bacterium]